MRFIFLSNFGQYYEAGGRKGSWEGWKETIDSDLATEYGLSHFNMVVVYRHGNNEIIACY